MTWLLPPRKSLRKSHATIHSRRHQHQSWCDHSSWPICLGQFGTGRMSENGQDLLELYCHHGLCVSNKFFNMEPRYRVSWRHPRSKHWHQLDLILTRCSSLPSIKITHSYQGADCDTDHSLVCSSETANKETVSDEKRGNTSH